MLQPSQIKGGKSEWGTTEENAMLGYMTAAQAKAHGFTHHGKYFGIPVWLGSPGEGMMVATKWAPMEYLMTAAQFIEQTLRSTFFPHEEPSFQFLVGAEL